MTTGILLATRNGMKFLPEQLASLSAQSAGDLDIAASDDGSDDGTAAFLADFAGKWDKGRFSLRKGPGSGDPTDNFRALVLGAGAGHDLVAFCDQDDVWMPEKLARAAAALEPFGALPAVCCSRTRLIDAAGSDLGLSKYFGLPPGFRNALVQSLAGGNTMVMNRAAFELVREAFSRAHPVAHDWWVYQIVTGAGGKVIYSQEPDTLYRQHGANVVGANGGVGGRIRRIGMLFQGRFRHWNDINLRALEQCRDLLTPDACRVMDDFISARRGNPVQRISRLLASGVYRQTRGGQAALWVACAIGLM